MRVYGISDFLSSLLLPPTFFLPPSFSLSPPPSFFLPPPSSITPSPFLALPCNHVTSQSVGVPPNAVLKFENLEEDFSRYVNKTIRLGHVNRTKHRPWREVFSDKPECTKLVNELYGRDFELFGYEMLTELKMRKRSVGRSVMER